MTRIAQREAAEHRPLLHPVGLSPFHPAGGSASHLLGEELPYRMVVTELLNSALSPVQEALDALENAVWKTTM